MEGNLPKFDNTDNLMINNENSADLRRAMCWAKFMAIVGFVFTGMMLVMSLVILFGGSSMACMSYGMCGGMGVMTGIMMLIMTAIYFFYSYFMYMFSTKIKKALVENNQQSLNHGIIHLRNYFMYTGIMMIVAIVFAVFSILFSGMMFASMM